MHYIDDILNMESYIINKVRSGLKPFIGVIILAVFTPLLTGCHDAPEYKDDLTGNFDALADIVGSRYCFFQEKGIDWQALCKDYRAKITPKTNQLELFEICSDLLDELQDGHVNLSSRFNTSYYRKWWSDYPQDFNLRTLQQYYLDFNYYTTSGISYKILDKNIGYMYYPSFSYSIGEVNLDYIFAILKDTDGLIIDIRNNGGGMLTNIQTLVGRFISKEIPGGYVRHKTGPEPDAFSDPYPLTYKPAGNGRVKYEGKPIIVLTNRSCFSAANNFVAVMKDLPNVLIVGARTGGGGGLPFSSELPNGWSVRFSACPMSDNDDRSIEAGIDPSPGCEVHAPETELAQGKDAILDFALSKLKPASGSKPALSPEDKRLPGCKLKTEN